jgi:hypothetical protein
MLSQTLFLHLGITPSPSTATNAGNTHNFSGDLHMLYVGTDLIYDIATITSKGASVTSLAITGTPAIGLQAVIRYGTYRIQFHHHTVISI